MFRGGDVLKASQARKMIVLVADKHKKITSATLKFSFVRRDILVSKWLDNGHNNCKTLSETVRNSKLYFERVWARRDLTSLAVIFNY